MMRAGFSVLISLYIREKPEYFMQCMKSIFAQTVLPSEIVIVKDGPITERLEAIIESARKKYPELIKTVCLPQNQGLGPALAEGIRHCSYELIARMDTDDIARRDRFERQLEEFSRDEELDILGSCIIEFSGSVKNTVSVRRVPLTHEEIVKYQKQRSAFNHVTVMYKKSAVLRAGNYQNAPFMEDGLLWIRMIQSGAKCRNLEDCLVYVRTGYEMMERRGGSDYFRKYRAGRRKMLETGYISRWDYYKTLWVQAVVTTLPNRLRMVVFTKLLRQAGYRSRTSGSVAGRRQVVRTHRRKTAGSPKMRPGNGR